MNAVRTSLLVLGLVAVAGIVGFSLLGGAGLVVGAAAVALFAGGGLGVSERWLLRVMGARRLGRWEAPGLHRMVERLSAQAGVGIPALYWLPSAEANALAVRQSDGPGALAVTVGAVELLDRDELEGVLAHEVAHLRNQDSRILRAASFLVGTTRWILTVGVWASLLAVLLDGGGVERLVLLSLLALVVPWILTLTQAALSRTRELAADETAVELTGRPLALARALAKMARQRSRRWPVWASRVPLELRTHPPTGERIRRLLERVEVPRRWGWRPCATC